MSDAITDPGARAVERCDHLGLPPYSERAEGLERPYLTPSHREALAKLGEWMEAAGMAVRIDALGNLIGRYEGIEPNAPALLIGSHIDSVENGGRYDGALGVMLGVECVQAFADAGRRLPFALEVIAFGDEEGSRFPTSMLCSHGISAPPATDLLELQDHAGVTVGQALAGFGLDPARAGEAVRKPSEIVAFLEPHIEQGPVLESENLPVGVVTGIAAQLRLKARFTGRAGHAGTTPMVLRRDALAAAAEAALAVEEICRAGPRDLVGTVGRIVTSTAAFNVIVGEAEVSIDLRAGEKAIRDAAAATLRMRLGAIARNRDVALEIIEVQDLPGAPCDRELTRRLGQAVERTGSRACFLMSGAGHDAMAVAKLAPVGMLFIRCAGGISHNPAESVAAADVGAAARALLAFIESLAEARR